MQWLIGVDEVGRGPLAGPLCVGACAVRRQHKRRVLASLQGLRECKQLTPERRLLWFARIREAALLGRITAVTSFVGERTIDRRGIRHALNIAIRRCLTRLGISPALCQVLLDGGLKAPSSFPFQKTITHGDETEALIALASIVAKVRRDRRMIRLARRFPQYGFERHKGYGTRRHYEALQKYGLCEVHRRSFLKKFQ